MPLAPALTLEMIRAIQADATVNLQNEIGRLLATLEYIASDVLCFSLEKATDAARAALDCKSPSA